ncbi:ScbA/BarX family gamma-butyrolactone biosynthesis protein [Actinopolyspora mortivallis]|uniref:ScbA/BarX family gamma-butyrolactone biosynthesis protein n=1 Tax=Actinopolyspora mortivallis TaxID=33906 RepID=UPI00035C4B64|nr:ScbA/BarX family gamma-butyrolactone biosynthesis protein [Actinopolyspora mortivallis]
MTATIAFDTAAVNTGQDPLVSFDQSLPRHWVHRAANTEVLVTSYGERGENAFVLGAQLPRAHALYGPVEGVHDPFLFVEAVRQAGLVVGHIGFGVPYGHQFAMDTLDYEVDCSELSLADAPAHVVLEVNCTNVKRRGKTFAGADMRVIGYRNGALLGRAMLPYYCISPAAYARLRAGAGDFADVESVVTPETDSPQRFGRSCSSDVLLAPTEEENTWLLRDGRNHPVLFDHPVDHVPGMTALEAVRQAACSVYHPHKVIPVGMESRFHHYVELGQACFVRVCEVEETGRVRIVLEQGGRTAVEVVVEVRVAGGIPTQVSG